MKRLSAISFAALLLLSAAACRHKAKPQPTPPPQPTVETTTPQPPAATVPSPEQDFPMNEQREVLPEELTELNRLAQERGWIKDAFFAFDASTLDAEAQAALERSASWLREHGDYGLLIEGHCDERGTEQYNLALGDRRAATAVDYLSTLGIDRGRIRTVSYGEERPFEEGSNEAAWAQNRRAHLVVVRR